MLDLMDEAGMAGLRIVDLVTKIWGYVRIEAYRKGVLFQVEEGHNVVVNNGRVHMLRLMAGVAGFTPVARMELGDGGCGPAPSGAALFTPIPFVVSSATLAQTLAKISPIESTLTSVDSGARTVTYVAFFSSAGTSGYHFTPHVVNEIALKSGSGDNVTMALRSFRSIPFDPTDAVDIKATWIIGLP